MDWSKVLLDNGATGLVLIAILLGIHRTVRWAAEHVAMPVVNAHVSYMEKQEAQAEKVATHMANTSECLAELAALNRDIHAALKQQ